VIWSRSVFSSLSEKLGLDAAQARRDSPVLNLPARATKLSSRYYAEPEIRRI
jgi:hypothetical protein